MILSPTRTQAEQAREQAAAILARLGLQLNPAKTSIVCLTRGRQGFDFLGFHLRKVESWRHRGRWYLHRWPSQRAMRSLRGHIRQLTQRRFVGLPLSTTVERLNPILRGWGTYFRCGNAAAKFSQIDSYVHERLAILASAKHGRAGRNWDTHYNYAWFRRLGVHRLSGTVRYGPAKAFR